jgi:hypothetical protein
MAFSQPSELGRSLAESYFGRLDFLVYSKSVIDTGNSFHRTHKTWQFKNIVLWNIFAHVVKAYLYCKDVVFHFSRHHLLLYGNISQLLFWHLAYYKQHGSRTNCRSTDAYRVINRNFFVDKSYHKWAQLITLVKRQSSNQGIFISFFQQNFYFKASTGLDVLGTNFCLSQPWLCHSSSHKFVLYLPVLRRKTRSSAETGEFGLVRSAMPIPSRRFSRSGL